MRCLIAMMVAAAALLAGTAPSRAQSEGPWCAIVFNGEGSVREICHFRTLEACIAEVVSGNRGQCGNNPRYAGARAAEQRSASRSKRKHRRQ